MVYQKQQVKRKCVICSKEFIGKKAQQYCSKAHKERAKTIRRRKFILDYKDGKSCSICGWNKHPEILQFHHINETGKEECVSQLVCQLKEKIIKEIEKCILVCPNCHSWIHFPNSLK